MINRRGNQRRYLEFSERLRRHLRRPITLKFLTYPTTFRCRAEKLQKLQRFFVTFTTITIGKATVFDAYLF